MMAELMFRKQKYEDAINLYQQVLEKAPGNCLHEDCPLRWPASVPRPARAALPKDGPPALRLRPQDHVQTGAQSNSVSPKTTLLQK